MAPRDPIAARPGVDWLRGSSRRALPTFLAPALIFALLVSGCVSGVSERTANPTQDPALPRFAPTGGFSGLDPRLSGPDLGPDATQADKGSVVYWAICMACHGDQGQGLTLEWRAVWGDDQNCWASKCHASNHPPEGFQLPRTVPALLGPGTMARFADARDLYAYLASTMPWWNPGSLTPEQALAVTAYLLRERKALPREVQLDQANLSAFRPNRVAPQRPFDRRMVTGAVALLVAAALSIALRRGRGE